MEFSALTVMRKKRKKINKSFVISVLYENCFLKNKYRSEKFTKQRLNTIPKFYKRKRKATNTKEQQNQKTRKKKKVLLKTQNQMNTIIRHM